MRIGLQIPSFTWPGGAEAIGPKLAEIARTAEDAGFYSIWVMDHLFQIPMVGPAEQEMLEGYSALSYLAGLTRSVRLGTLVTGITYRHPGVLAKSVSTLDVLSGGRAYLGIGAAWFEREHEGLGIPFPPLRERFERLEETLQIVQQMWSEQSGPYVGRHYRLNETLNVPQPLTRPHPPILIGGACNLFLFIGMPELRRKLDVLARHCEDFGRPLEEIERTTLGTVHLAPSGTTPKAVIETCRELAAMGVQQAIFNLPNLSEVEPLEVFGREIIPEVAGF
jgi:F420-dependent oxidoreductase-like protein